MTIRTVILRLRNKPALSRLIGELQSQQRLAYNWGVDQLNWQPGLEMRTVARLGYTNTLSSRFGPVRKAAPARWWVPRYIHQDGYEKAYLANERFAQDRTERLGRIADAQAKGEEPRARDIRPHRPTLKHRRRKGGRSLAISRLEPSEIRSRGLP